MINELEALVLKYNSVAMEYLKLENFKDSQTLLKKAEEILNSDENEIIPNRLKLMGITLNNLGCYYKRRKQPKVALTFLKRALEVELQTESDNVNLAGSHLNICAVYSSLARHKEALIHARQAMTLLESVKDEDGYTFEKTVTLMTSLVITYFNVGVELEHLKKFSEAYGYYQNGYEIAVKELGSRHPLTISLADASLKMSSKAKSLERISKSNVRDGRSKIRLMKTGDSYRLPSVGRHRPKENPIKIKNRLATAYERLRDMTFQAPI